VIDRKIRKAFGNPRVSPEEDGSYRSGMKERTAIDRPDERGTSEIRRAPVRKGRRSIPRAINPFT